MAEHTQLQTQIDALAAFYQSYLNECQKYIQEHSGLEHLGEWIFGSHKFADDRMHTDFHEGVKKLVSELDAALGRADRETARDYALKALYIIVDPIEESARDESGWMRFATEPASEPLLTYLDADSLEAFLERYNDAYPKRLQFPNQKKYRKTMETLLKQKKKART